MQRDVDVRREVRDVLCLVERDDLRAAVVEVLGQPAALRPEAVVRVRDRQIDRLDAHLEYVARVRALDEDWARKNVSAGATILYRVVNRAQRRLYIVRLDADLLETSGARRDHRADDHVVARLHAQHWYGRGVVVA